MTITGIIKYVSPIESVTSKTTQKTYNKVEFVIEEVGVQYPQSAKLTLFGEKVDEYLAILKSNALVTAKFDVKCRMHEGSFFNSLNAWSVTLAAVPQQVQPTQPMQQPQPQQWAQNVQQQFEVHGIPAQPTQDNGLPF